MASKARRAHIRAWWKDLQAEYSLLRKYELVFNGRLRRTLGVCVFSFLRPRIELASVIVDREDVDLDVVIETLLHEAAHALAGSDAGHGPKWKEQARRLGIAPNRLCSHPDARKVYRDTANYLIWCDSCDKKWHRQRLAARYREWLNPPGLNRMGRKCDCGGCLHAKDLRKES